MTYVIVYLIKGEAGKFQQDLTHEIAKKFKHDGTIKSKIPAHLTLKSRFETNNIEEVEKAIKGFTDKEGASSLALDGYGYFSEPKVIFIKVKESKEMRDSYNKLMEKLKKISWLPMSELDRKGMKFHSTIAHKNLPEEKFDDIWQYLKNKPKPYFGLNFDNISILKLIDGVWQIHKEFLISNPPKKSNRYLKR